MKRLLYTLHLEDALPSQSGENSRTQASIHAFPFGIMEEDSAEQCDLEFGGLPGAEESGPLLVPRITPHIRISGAFHHT